MCPPGTSVPDGHTVKGVSYLTVRDSFFLAVLPLWFPFKEHSNSLMRALIHTTITTGTTVVMNHPRIFYAEVFHRAVRHTKITFRAILMNIDGF